MKIIRLRTNISAPIERCFDLSRSIDLHTISTAYTNEKAIAGVVSGLIDFGDTVTWQATHFGISQRLTSKITAFSRPFHFRDEQTQGAFRYFLHDHSFEETNGLVEMRDVFEFQSPAGLLGRFADKVILHNYMKKLLLRRNEVIRTFAESEQWKTVLNIPKTIL